ncbi:MAG: DMT family transporter [Acidimicrobiales bacterium]
MATSTPTVTPTSARPMSRRGWSLFAAQSVIWGAPYLLISIAVESLAPASVVAGRTLIAAVLLLPVAIRQGALRPALARPHLPWVLAFAVIEMAGPFLLLGQAEQTLPSGVTALLVATVPIFGAIVAFGLGDRHALGVVRLVGMAIGLAGVALVVGAASGDGEVHLRNVSEVLVVAVCYAIAPFITYRKLDGVPGIGIATVALGAVGVGYLPVALAVQDGAPSGRSIAALVALAVLCTSVAFVTFFALIREVGPDRATLITFVNPVVALLLGFVVLDERLSAGQLLGLPLVLGGCWLATRRPSGEPSGDGPLLVPEP